MDFLNKDDKMITVTNLGVQYGGSVLFKNADLQFNPRQLLRRHRRQRCGQIHLVEDSLRRQSSPPTVTVDDIKPGRSHVRFETGSVPVRRLYRAGHRHHGQPAASMTSASRRTPSMQKRISPTKTAFSPPNWRTEFAELGGWEAESPMLAGCSRGWAFAVEDARNPAWPTWMAATR